MKTPLDNDLNKVYESFNQNHNHLRQTLMASLPKSIKQHKRAGRISHTLAFIGETIMRSRITKLATAAGIIIAVMVGINYLGGSPDGASVAWGDIVKRVERSHDKYSKELLLAFEAEDVEKISSRADMLSEFWQRLGWLVRAELDPELQARLSIEIVREKTVNNSFEESDQIFLAYADEFLGWIEKIDDVAWFDEIIHACKQMEEYAEEIRDGARSSELTYIEHCLPSFITYSESFKHLSWDNPGRDMTPAALLAGIERDLKIAHREIENLEIKDTDRYAKRCLQQARRNILNVEKRIEPQMLEYKNQRKMCKQLTRKIDHLSELLTYAVIASWDIQQTYEIDTDKAFRRVLRKEFGGTESFGDFFLDQIEQSLDLCKELSQNFESKQ